MAWKRRKFARTTEALRAATTYMFGEPIIPADGANAGRLFVGDNATAGGRGLAFIDEVSAPGPGSIGTSQLASKAVTAVKMEDMAEARISGRAAGVGQGSRQALTAADVKTILALSVGDVGGALASANNLLDLASIAAALVNLGFTKSLGTSGYAKIGNNGLIIQWGKYNGGGDTTITMPANFPSEIVGVYGVVISDSSATAMYSAHVWPINTGQFRLRPRYTNGGSQAIPSEGVFWLAGGY